ncbi:MAG TPA: AI-2E family transporter [Bryobacteraceae bacterium]|nr:AI-2E family transporter [Bryobacteraceae bacterium]
MKQSSQESGLGQAGQAIILFGTVAILYFAREILVPLALAVILAFLLTPAVNLLQRIGIGRVPAVVVTVLVVTLAVGLAGWVIASQLLDVANQLPKYKLNIDAKIASLHTPTGGALGQAENSIKEIGRELVEPLAPEKQPVPVTVVPTDENALSSIWQIAKPSLVPLASTGIVLIFSIFVLIEKEDLRDRLLRLAGTGQLNVMTEAIDDAANRVSRYLSMQVLVNTVFGVSIGTGLYFIGLPNAALWGVVAGMLRLVPYAGTLIAGALPLALSLAVFDTWTHPLMVFVLFGAIELITANFVEPWLYGVHTGISSLALLVATVFWTALWGPAGLILATPMTVCLVVLGRYIPQLSFLQILLGDEPVLEPSAQVYQRLLAMDQEDARLVVVSFMKDATLTQLYDSVLIPTLALAEQDRHRAALDEKREEFLFLNINEMVAEFSESVPSTPAPEGLAGGRVLCVPAHDQADEIAAAMLAQLLEHEGFIALSFPIGENLEDVLELMQPGESDLICVSALPPFAFSPARSVCRRIRARFPKLKLVAGMWGFSGESKKAMARFDRTPPDFLFTNFAQVLDYIRAEAAARAGTETATR